MVLYCHLVSRRDEVVDGPLPRASSDHRSPVFLLEGGLDWSSTARGLSIPYFIFKGGLVDPRLRASNEHILIVRVPRAGGRLGCPSHPSEAARSGTIGPTRAFCCSLPYSAPSNRRGGLAVSNDRALREHRRLSGSIPSSAL